MNLPDCFWSIINSNPQRMPHLTRSISSGRKARNVFSDNKYCSERQKENALHHLTANYLGFIVSWPNCSMKHAI